MHTIVLRTLIALALVTIVNFAAPAAELTDWSKVTARWEEAVKVKTDGIAELERIYVGGLCQAQRTEHKKKECITAFKRIIDRRAKERTLFEEMIKANSLPPAERDRRGNGLFVEHAKSNEETNRLFHAANKEFRDP